MTQTYYGLALNLPAVSQLDLHGLHLDEVARNKLYAHVQTMEQIVEQTRAAQDAVSSIYANTLWIADASMATLAYIKTTHTRPLAEVELEAFERSQSKLLLEALQQLAFNGFHSVFTDLE